MLNSKVAYVFLALAAFFALFLYIQDNKQTRALFLKNNLSKFNSLAKDIIRLRKDVREKNIFLFITPSKGWIRRDSKNQNRFNSLGFDKGTLSKVQKKLSDLNIIELFIYVPDDDRPISFELITEYKGLLLDGYSVGYKYSEGKEKTYNDFKKQFPLPISKNEDLYMEPIIENWYSYGDDDARR